VEFFGVLCAEFFWVFGLLLRSFHQTTSTTWSPGICQVATVCSGGGTVYYMCTYTELLSG
jgi:hypothetical protein